MTRVEFLDKAKEQINGSRVTDYGKPENNFGVIAGLWSAYLGIDISAVDVTMMMSLLKIARVKSGHGGTEDCFVDLAGYAACGGEIASNKKSAGVVPASPKHDDLVDGIRYFNKLVAQHIASKDKDAKPSLKTEPNVGKNFFELISDDPVKEPKIGDDWAKEPKITCEIDKLQKEKNSN